MGEVERQIAQLFADRDALIARMEQVESKLSTLGSPWYKRAWFRIDGWPPWYVNATGRRARPWHRG